jgi:hypothetical protein
VKRDREHSVFDGYWRKPRRDGAGGNARDLQERASYDQDPSRKANRRDRRKGGDRS